MRTAPRESLKMSTGPADIKSQGKMRHSNFWKEYKMIVLVNVTETFFFLSMIKQRRNDCYKKACWKQWAALFVPRATLNTHRSEALIGANADHENGITSEPDPSEKQSPRIKHHPTITPGTEELLTDLCAEIIEKPAAEDLGQRETRKVSLTASGSSEPAGVNSYGTATGLVAGSIQSTTESSLSTLSKSPESSVVADSIGEAQERDFMSVDRDRFAVEGEGANEDKHGDGYSNVSGYATKSAIADITVDITASKDRAAVNGGEEGGGGCGNGALLTLSGASSAFQEGIAPQPTITALELAAAAKEETLPQRRQDSIMASTRALCKYRWAKVVSTNSADVGFYPSYAPVST
ncbi:hypothetical protein EGW08_000708 [Elysia chlorotica]|uniref:Uncharacterized protein n=1 Tax=Elysia chlorotica TaxID=188477 RepID=A0A3S1I3L3_ELYCH|nr:hypothetical protein EGW08_000708 [Elysia chlorotica]